MKGNFKVLASYGLWFQGISALKPARNPSVTVINHVNIAVRQATETAGPLLQARAVAPVEPGQIGVSPPGTEPPPANIEGHTKYLTLEDGTTKWIGVDPVNIEIKTTTTTKKGGATAVATITKGVEAVKNAAGGLDILLSPAVKAKLEAIAKQVTPCAAKRRRAYRKRHSKRGGDACGLADFVQRVGADPELQGNFAEPLTDQVWHESADEGYESDPEQDGGWEGDGGEHVPGEDEGYFSDDGEGFYEGVEGGEADTTVETIVFSTEEEAAALGAALSSGDAAVVAAYGGSTITAGSFMAWLWGTLKSGASIPNANSIPKESIHKVTKTKTKTTSQTATDTTSSSSNCPTGAPPECKDDCIPTSTNVDIPNVTGVVDWVCSEGGQKGCKCDPPVIDRIDLYDGNFHQAVFDAIKEIGEKPKDPTIECPGGFSNAPSKFFVDTTAKGFCEEVMKDLNSNNGPAAYDIHGNKKPILKQVKLAGEQARRNLGKRSPPEDINNYNDYNFFLAYTHEDGQCQVPKEDLCRSSFDMLAKANCGINHGSAGDRMSVDASIDVGCGKFTWHVEAPPKVDPPTPTPALNVRTCHPKHNHDEVHDNQQDTWSTIGCKWFAEGKTMKAGDPEIYWHPIGMFADLNDNFKISWIDGCKTTVPEQKLDFPIDSDQSVTCYSLLRANLVECRDSEGNESAGGSIDAGCIRYDFYM